MNSYRQLVKGWAHGFENDEFRTDSLNRVEEILSDFPDATGEEIVEYASKNDKDFREIYRMTFYDIQHRELFVGDANKHFFRDVMREIAKSLIAMRPSSREVER